MAGRMRYLSTNVFEESMHRIRKIYADGHRILVAISGGKDSTVMVEMCILAATMENRLPVECWLQDEEVAFPGTYEYIERLANRPEIDFNWFLCNQPMINVANRENPYFWVFDDRLTPEEWVRQPPSFAKELPGGTWEIDYVVMPGRFPPAAGKDLINVQGLRTVESQYRKLAMLSAGGYLTKRRPRNNVRAAYPIYDWGETDIWTALRQFKWEYNTAYDVMYRLNVPVDLRRIGPPTMNTASLNGLLVGAKAYPEWAERVYARLPGTRNAVRYGAAAVKPRRKAGESWEQAFNRLCLDEAPEWIADRCILLRDTIMKRWVGYAGNKPLPESSPPGHPNLRLASWRKLTQIGYNGDPFSSLSKGILPWVEPEFFRPGSGTWFNKEQAKELRKFPNEVNGRKYETV